MSNTVPGTDAGRRNIVVGILLFAVCGIVAGIPLTINLLGGSVLSDTAYAQWKVLHGYGVFLAFINYFVGVALDRLRFTPMQARLTSWSFVIAGLLGGIGRMVLALLSALTQYGRMLSFAETLFISVGTLVFVLGHVRQSRPFPVAGG